MYTITLPDLAGTRVRAAFIAHAAPDTLAGETVLIDATANKVTTYPFCDELTEQIFDRGAEHIVLRNAGTDELRYFDEATRIRGLRDHLSIETPTPVF
jgi:hypothetical protein